jgi:hypothetical protein
MSVVEGKSVAELHKLPDNWQELLLAIKEKYQAKMKSIKFKYDFEMIRRRI